MNISLFARSGFDLGDIARLLHPLFPFSKSAEFGHVRVSYRV